LRSSMASRSPPWVRLAVKRLLDEGVKLSVPPRRD
jgi:hypothetical protein